MRGTTAVLSVYTIIRRDNTIALVMRENTGYKDGFYCLPSGHVERDESFKVAAAREALEESNVKVDLKDLRFVHMMQRHCGDHMRVDVFFEADTWSGEPRNMEPDRHSSLDWFPEDDLPFDKIIDFQVEALRAILNDKTYSEFGWPGQ